MPKEISKIKVGMWYRDRLFGDWVQVTKIKKTEKTIFPEISFKKIKMDLLKLRREHGIKMDVMLGDMNEYFEWAGRVQKILPENIFLQLYEEMADSPFTVN